MRNTGDGCVTGMWNTGDGSVSGMWNTAFLLLRKNPGFTALEARTRIGIAKRSVTCPRLREGVDSSVSVVISELIIIFLYAAENGAG